MVNDAQVDTMVAVADQLAGLDALDGDDLGGLTYPLRFTPRHPAERRACWSVVVIERRQWTAPLGGRLGCAA